MIRILTAASLQRALAQRSPAFHSRLPEENIVPGKICMTGYQIPPDYLRIAKQACHVYLAQLEGTFTSTIVAAVSRNL